MDLISLTFLFLAFGIPGSNEVRPRRTCKSPLSEDCIPFEPDPEPSHYPPVPPDTDDFWSQPENLAITGDLDIKFSQDDAGAFAVPQTRLYRYFKGADIAGVAELYREAKFELIEWPGKKTDSNRRDKDKNAFQDSLGQTIIGSTGSSFIPFSYQGLQTKFLGYLCNPLQGTHVRALGFRMRPEVVRISHRNYIPFYLTVGSESFQGKYTQPLFILVRFLNEMAKDHTDPFCQPAVDDRLTVQSRLNHILDFSFTSGRLLIGMYCGILIVRNFETSAIGFKLATRNPLPDAYDENDFIKDTFVKFTDTETFRQPKFPPINIISASTCCKSEVFCTRQIPLAAAYSYNKFSRGDGIQEIFVSTDLGDTFDAKIISSEHTVLHMIRSLYEVHSPESVEPYWVTEEILKLKNEGKWVENDPVVERIVSQNRSVEVNRTDNDCREIVSLRVVAEDRSILALCRMSPAELFDEKTERPMATAVTVLPPGGGPAVPPPVVAPTLSKPMSAPDNKFAIYAVFEMQLSRANPTIPIVRKTKARLPCTLRAINISNEFEFYEPSLERTTKSHNLFVTGCSTVIYHSVNGGHTFWHTFFYRRYDTGLFRRFRQDDKMDNPIVASNEDSIVFLNGDWYAFGQINMNREFRIVMDQVARTDGVLRDIGRCENKDEQKGNCTKCRNVVSQIPQCDIVIPKCESIDADNLELCGVYWDTVINFASVTKFLPYYSNSGLLVFSFVAIHILRGNQITQTFSARYAERNAIRLIDFPTRISSAVRPYYSENQNISAPNKFKGFSKCTTSSFTLKPAYISFDVGDTAMIKVSSEDLSESLPLGIISSQTTALHFEVIPSKISAAAAIQETHEYEVKVTALGQLKTRIHRREDAFFGSEYSKYVAVATYTIFTHFPAIRCHVQPLGFVYIDTSCAGKALVIHEDYNRPQCGQFFNNTFKIPDFVEGTYDPELMEYWLLTRPQFYQTESDEKGATRIKVSYDYETFGCPILPYRTDDLVPDLRVTRIQEEVNSLDVNINSNLSHTSIGLKYNLKYILVEIHGATGFTYTKTVRDAKCVRPPQTFKQMLAEWKIRKRVLQGATQNYRGFRPDAVLDPQNIWNRITYEDEVKRNRKLSSETYEIFRSFFYFQLRAAPRIGSNYLACQERGSFVGELSDEILDSPYEILQRNETHPEEENMIRWVDLSKTLYIFAAIEVDRDGTFCQFRTYFAVHIKGTEETDDLATIYRFVAFFLFFLLLVFLGFYVYRAHLRRVYRKTALYSRLERAAWQILFRYEKFIHEVKVKMEDHDRDAVWNRIEASEYDQELIDKAKATANKANKPSVVGSKKTLSRRKQSQSKIKK